MSKSREFVRSITEGTLSVSDVKSFKSDWDKLVKIYSDQKYKDIDTAIKGHKEIEGLFKTYFKNLRDFVEYQAGLSLLRSEVSPSASKPMSKMTHTDKPALLLSKLISSVENIFYRVNPSKWLENPAVPVEDQRKEINDNIDFWVNNALKAVFADKNSYYEPKEGKPQNIAKNLFASINDLIKLIAKHREHDPKKKTVTVHDTPKTFSYMGLTFSNQLLYRDDIVKDYIEAMSPLLRILKKLLPEVFNGVINLIPKPANYRKFTTKYGSAVAGGIYSYPKDSVEIYADKPLDDIPHISYILVHELAHRYWFKFMTASQRQAYKHFFKDLSGKGDRVTRYANENEAEDFAETVTYYVIAKGNMKNKDARARLEAILGGRKLRESKAKQFLCLFTEKNYLLKEGR